MDICHNFLTAVFSQKVYSVRKILPRREGTLSTMTQPQIQLVSRSPANFGRGLILLFVNEPIVKSSKLLFSILMDTRHVICCLFFQAILVKYHNSPGGKPLV